MKIFNISLLGLNNIKSQGLSPRQQSHDYNSSFYLTNQPYKDCFEREKQIPFEGRLITSQSKFKSLVRTKTLHCIYCNKVLLDENELNNLEKSGLFQGPIKDFVSKTKKYYNSLHTPHRTVFNIISGYAKRSPQTTLSQVMQDLYPKALRNQLKIQKPVFEKLTNLAKQLPEEYKERFQKFIAVQYNRLKNKAYVNEFSGKEFGYKLKNMCKTIQNDRLTNLMITQSSYLSHPSFKEKGGIINNELRAKIFSIKAKSPKNIENLLKDYPKTRENIGLYIIQNIRQIGQKLSRDDIIKLCDNASNEILGIPVKVQFSNKSFRYDLDEALSGLPNQDLKKKMMELTYKLPTSMDNAYAFIIKHANASSDKIGHNILFPSTVTIEHMHTRFERGKSEMKNYALSCAYDNNYVRSNHNMKVVLRRYDKNNPQKYFNEIFEVLKEGRLSVEDVLGQVETFQKQSGMKIDISPIKELVEDYKKEAIILKEATKHKKKK